MGNSKRYFRLIVEEAETGTSVSVSANADRNFLFSNIVSTMMEHEALYDIITTCAGAALYTKEKAAEMGITGAELMKRVSTPDSECASDDSSEAVTNEEDNIEPKNQALIDEMKHILNGGK